LHAQHSLFSGLLDKDALRLLIAGLLSTF